MSVCRICAASLLPVPERPPRGQRKHSPARAAAPPSTKNTRWWLAFGVLAIALVLIGARMATSSQAETQATAVATTEAPEPAAALASQADGAGSSAGDSLAEATAAAEARLQASLERLAREDRQHQEAQARAARERERRQAEQARQREASTASTGSATAQAPRRIEPAIPAVAKAPDTPAMPASPSTATEAPGPAASVTKQCADSSNFFSRSICERRICEDAALAQDPVCRRLRELDQASRPDPYLLN
ncbi:MAG: hypothetical protein R3E94_03045 [Burkholderiaceae bacterium]